jgi:hypothetical protein
MKQFYAFLSLILGAVAFFITLLLINLSTQAQSCTPQGNQTTYGSNNTWIGYVYQGMNFNTYKGYVTEGNATSPNFDESFGGQQVNYNTNGCTVYTDTFSVRYKLTQTFANGNYQITVGGDDGYRLSLDGGATWAINQWNDQGYATTTYNIALNGSTNLVLEYYEHFGANRISFNITAICTGTGDPTVYGTNNVWNGYLYQGMNFNMYKGQVAEGSSSNPAFDENFGNPSGNNITYNTNSCSIQTNQFSARYRLQQTLAPAKYVITVGGDDGFRFSLDGGNTWVINKWNDQVYTTASYTATLSGSYNMVLEYYQNAGNDRVTFTMTSTLLPVTLVKWSATALSDNQAQLQWQTTNAVNFDHFIVQRSSDGVNFQDINTTPGFNNNSTIQNYSYTDDFARNGNLYYRLAMVDIDGSVNYSNIISLSGNTTQNISIFPTMIENGSVYINAPQSVSRAKMELFDMNGRMINQKDWAVLEGRQQVPLTNNGHSTLPAGCYIVRLSDSQSVLAKQIIVVR